MRTILRATTTVLAMLLVSAFGVLPAAAGCGPFSAPKAEALLQQQSWEGQGKFQPAWLIRASNRTDVDPIVGFWQVALSSDGQPIDAGYVQWHSDGTEIMNSSRPPATQSFCLGVWKRTAGGSYLLNHFALSFDASGNMIGPANIRETIRVGRGANTYSGTFTLDQYDTSGNLLIHIAGDVTATRITVNTPPAKSF